MGHGGNQVAQQIIIPMIWKDLYPKDVSTCFCACQWHLRPVQPGIHKGGGRRGKGESPDPSKPNKTCEVANNGAVTAVKPSDQESFLIRVSSFPCCTSLPKPRHIIRICLFLLSTPKQPFRCSIVPLFARHILVPYTPDDMLPFRLLVGNAVTGTFAYYLISIAPYMPVGDVHSIMFFVTILILGNCAFRDDGAFEHADMENWSRLTTLFLLVFQKEGVQLFNLARSQEWLQLCELCLRLASMSYSTGNVLGGFDAMQVNLRPADPPPLYLWLIADI